MRGVAFHTFSDQSNADCRGLWSDKCAAVRTALHCPIWTLRRHALLSISPTRGAGSLAENKTNPVQRMVLDSAAQGCKHERRSGVLGLLLDGGCPSREICPRPPQSPLKRPSILSVSRLLFSRRELLHEHSACDVMFRRKARSNTPIWATDLSSRFSEVAETKESRFAFKHKDGCSKRWEKTQQVF